MTSSRVKNAGFLLQNPEAGAVVLRLLSSLSPETTWHCQGDPRLKGCNTLELTLWLQSPVAFTTVGIASVIAAIARLLSLFIDRSFSIKNVGGVFTEAILGAMLLLGGLS